jgi:tRNA (cytidine/uridine-2'-O-)-methyltransferase
LPCEADAAAKIWRRAQLLAARHRIVRNAEVGAMLHVVLVEPEIPPNTGNVGRLCLATGAHLHLVKPLGFSLDDRALRRAGLDYWADVPVTVWNTFDALRTAQPPGTRFFLFTTKVTRRHWDVQFRDGDFLVFGRETKGLPASLLAAHDSQCVTIAMRGETTRSLNLATAVGIAVYEAWRQIDAHGNQFSSSE